MRIRSSQRQEVTLVTMMRMKKMNSRAVVANVDQLLKNTLKNMYSIFELQLNLTAAIDKY